MLVLLVCNTGAVSTNIATLYKTTLEALVSFFFFIKVLPQNTHLLYQLQKCFYGKAAAVDGVLLKVMKWCYDRTSGDV